MVGIVYVLSKYYLSQFSFGDHGTVIQRSVVGHNGLAFAFHPVNYNEITIVHIDFNVSTI